MLFYDDGPVKKLALPRQECQSIAFTPQSASAASTVSYWGTSPSTFVTRNSAITRSETLASAKFRWCRWQDAYALRIAPRPAESMYGTSASTMISAPAFSLSHYVLELKQCVERQRTTQVQNGGAALELCAVRISHLSMDSTLLNPYDVLLQRGVYNRG